MNFVNDFALLVAVAAPVMTLLAMQAALFAAGERHTLLLPGFDRYPSLMPLTAAQFAAGLAAMPAATSAGPVGEASNDDTFFRAA